MRLCGEKNVYLFKRKDESESADKSNCPIYGVFERPAKKVTYSSSFYKHAVLDSHHAKRRGVGDDSITTEVSAQS